ncbi:pyridoxal phosphate-dependent aminotransferase [Alkalisalibacterium limincola]|uniref:Pyridoxal phosphate-dependent aminotransferase n=1 Tax=Alkalisalibacterium limincola TaxID=2699169 RepID=A0A5C8KVG9_9GAMM|nr:pyridoxal phosphate-dependent aminotransferase [Alkalisalibacterium limincola]TXK65759.1 pyridoxal phosphate-dependent aminotransferase [Alkalisalibacterium limincola]
MQIQTRLPKVGTTIFTVMSQLAVQHGAINMGQGFPDFDAPGFLLDGFERAMRSGKNQYAMATGIAPLRQAIAAKTEAMYGRAIDADTDVTVTSGASEAILDAVMALVHPGEEVIVLDPCYDCYEPAIHMAGADAVHVPLDPDSFAVDWDRVRDAITSKTRMLFINSPHNPSGAVLGEADMATLAELVRGTRIIILSDEVYEHIIYDDARHESVLRHPELAERSVVVSSFGKTYHCTGWKVGYAVAPAALSAEIRKVHQYNTFCTMQPAQWAFAEAIEQHADHHLGLGAFYQPKRDRFRELLGQTKLRALPVPGGYFQLADYSAVSDLDDLAFARWLTIEHGVTGVPLSPFYETAPEGQRLIRLCFAKDEATMVAATERLARL